MYVMLCSSILFIALGNIQFDDVVVISGCGPLGLGMVAAAKQKSPVKLAALDLYDWKVIPTWTPLHANAIPYSCNNVF